MSHDNPEETPEQYDARVHRIKRISIAESPRIFPEEMQPMDWREQEDGDFEPDSMMG